MLYVTESLTDSDLPTSWSPRADRSRIGDASVPCRVRAEFARRNDSPPVRAAREALAASGLRESDPEAYRQRAFALSVAGYFADPAQMPALTPFRVVGRTQRSVWESLNGYDLLPALARRSRQMGVPTLVVHGREDPIPLASSTAVADALGAELLVIEGSGHVPYVESPEILFSDAGAISRPGLAFGPRAGRGAGQPHESVIVTRAPSRQPPIRSRWRSGRSMSTIAGCACRCTRSSMGSNTWDVCGSLMRRGTRTPAFRIAAPSRAHGRRRPRDGHCASARTIWCAGITAAWPRNAGIIASAA